MLLGLNTMLFPRLALEYRVFYPKNCKIKSKNILYKIAQEFKTAGKMKLNFICQDIGQL